MSQLKPADMQDPKIDSLLGELGELIRQARQKVLRAVDTIQVQTCWQIGRHIVELEQQGAQRAGYGKTADWPAGEGPDWAVRERI